MSSPSVQSLTRTGALIAALAALLVIAMAPAQSDARGGGCGKTGVASKRSDRVALPRARDAVKCLINDERSAGNLKLNRKLSKAAQRHTRYMYRHGCFAHQCSGEAGTADRIRNAGYMRGASSYRIGEVIALNSDKASPREVVRQWKRSAGHRVQIMSSGYEHMGVGMVARKGRAFYTVTLGAKSG
jgi:uncharacterized protein YkwD